MFIQLYEEKYMRFPEGKAKALTLSYDDGVQADIRLLKIFNKHGLKGAFNLNSKLFDCAEWHGRMDEEQTLKTFCECGQEIALHGARHIFLDKVPLAEGVKEVADNRAYLEDKFGTIVRGMAYAYGAFTADIKRVLKIWAWHMPAPPYLPIPLLSLTIGLNSTPPVIIRKRSLHGLPTSFSPRRRRTRPNTGNPGCSTCGGTASSLTITTIGTLSKILRRARKSTPTACGLPPIFRFTNTLRRTKLLFSLLTAKGCTTLRRYPFGWS